jgi:hypothetical protein
MLNTRTWAQSLSGHVPVAAVNSRTAMRIENTQDLDNDLASWLQEAHDYRKLKDQGRDMSGWKA